MRSLSTTTKEQPLIATTRENLPQPRRTITAKNNNNLKYSINIGFIFGEGYISNVSVKTNNQNSSETVLTQLIKEGRIKASYFYSGKVIIKSFKPHPQ